MEKNKNRPQVFINFRGKDVRKKLLPHLKLHLKARNVNVFTDYDATGELVDNLFKHIRNSRIVIVIFSINYLESRWCLDELVEIKKCLETEKLDFVIPIFYKVKPSHVKKQSGKFGEKFIALQNTHRKSRVNRWKKSLRFVAKSIGLSYQKKRSISELDFIMKIVERVGITLAKIAAKDDNNHNSLEISTREASNPVVFDVNHSTVGALSLERSYVRGLTFESAWKDVIISSMQSSNSFRITPHANSLQFHMNTQSQSFSAQRNEFLNRAINWLALHMMSEQTQPALIFSNWDKLDHYTKNNIINSAIRKCQMLKGYNGGIASRPFWSSNFPPLLEVSTRYRVLEPQVPQDWLHTISYRNNIDQSFQSPYGVTLAQNPVVHRQSRGYTLACASYYSSPIREGRSSTAPSDDVNNKKKSCFSFFCYYFKSCFSFKRRAKEVNED